MKKYILIWAIGCIVLILFSIKPKVIYKEIPVYKIKKEVQYVEKEVFKGEKIVEKSVEKIVYKPTEVDIFLIERISENYYCITVNNKKWSRGTIKTVNNKIYIEGEDFIQQCSSGAVVGLGY